MTGKTARLIFLLGTLSSAAIFLCMTYDFHRQTPRYTTHGSQITVWHLFTLKALEEGAAE